MSTTLADVIQEASGMKTLFTISFTVLQFLFASRAEGLTCLKCDSVPQPRFCNKVVECFDGEECSVQKTLNEFGEHTYKLGCLSNKVCSHFRNASLSPTITCAECCASDNLCNSEGCGETGYPQERGPVCYNCPLHTNTAPCHDIEFCFIGEVCSIVGKDLFSSTVYTSTCVSKHECKPADGSLISIVGKRYSDVHQQHSCDLCCTADICNKNCTTARINNDPCMSNPCLHGTCISKGDNFECVCSAGYSGRFCENDIDDCKSQPCLHGTCSDHINRHSCTCAAGYTGINCETDIDECGSVECGNGTCIDGVGNYTCACNTGFAGRFCGERKVTDCYDLYHTDGKRTDGVYTIYTWKSQDRVNVYCDMTTDGGGWTVFQYRFNGSVDFYRNFSEYENGFGNLNSEFWLGLRYIQEIASQDQTDLRIDLEAPNGTKAFEEFEAFHLSPGPDYTLYLGRTIDSLRSTIPVAEFLKDPASWVAQPGCECRSAGVGIVHEVTPLYTAGTGGALPGLTSTETAVLAGVLTGLATFLFLLLPILCCLCPLPWACCGGGKKKAAAVSGGHRHGNLARSDESFWSSGSWGKGDKMDYEHLYGVDMKLPRPWVDNSSNHFDAKDGGWEGVDMTRDEIDAAVRAGTSGGEEITAQSGVVAYASGDVGHDNAAYSSAERSRGGGEEVITEYTTTRRVDMHLGAMSPEEAEGYYTQTYGHILPRRYRKFQKQKKNIVL